MHTFCLYDMLLFLGHIRLYCNLPPNTFLVKLAQVVAVCSLHHYCGTQSDGTGAVVGKALVRILRNAREIQYMVLKVRMQQGRRRQEGVISDAIL